MLNYEDTLPEMPAYPTEPTTSRTTWLGEVDSEPDGYYAPWYACMAEVQTAIDLGYEDSMWGYDVTEQADRMRARLETALEELEQVARTLDRRTYAQ
jgi:hypothetical protein